ncbi:MAG: Ig-like domain-containing protein, partial [Anaerolineae bacterium]|nr:Ig-like domain-containing protein [Anaerolineae bacterium]
ASWGSPIHAYGYPGDITVLKLNNNGVYQWHTFLGSLATQEAVGNDIALDSSGNLYVVGQGKDINGCGTPIHSASSTTVVDNNIIVLKLDASGACQWHTLYGDNADSWGLKLIRNQNGGLLVGGLTKGSWSGEGGAAPLHAFTAGVRNLVLIKLGSDGTYGWHTFYGSNEMTRIGMAANTSGNIYITNTSYAAWTVTNPVLKNPYTATDREISLLKLYDDAVSPTVTINRASGQTDPTNGTSVVFDVVFNEAVTGFDASDVDLSASSEWWLLSANVTANSATSYTVTVSGMSSNSSGQVTASIPAGAAKDASNNLSEVSTSTDNSVVYDTVAPTVTINQAAAQPNPTNTAPIVFDVLFDEAVTGFSAGDISFTGSTATGTLAAAISGTGPDYTVTVTGMTGSGAVVASIPAGAAKDASNNLSEASTSTDNSVVYDVTAPNVTLNQAAAQPDPTNTASIVFDVLFDKAVTGFSAGDISFTGSTAAGTLAAAISGTGPAYTVTVTGMTGSGAVVAGIPAGAAQDTAGNTNLTSTSGDNSVTYTDITGPTVSVEQAASQVDPTHTGSLKFDVTFNESVTDFTAGDVAFTGSTAPGTLAATVMGSGSVYVVTVDGMTGTGLVVVSIPAGSAHDSSGNSNSASTGSDNKIQYNDIAAPTVSVEQATGQTDPTNDAEIVFSVVFSEAVLGFEPADISFAGSTAPGTLSAVVNGSGAIYTVTVTGMTGNGLVMISISAGAAQDSSGNGNLASTSTDNGVTYIDNTGPEVTIEQAGGQADPTRDTQIFFDVLFSEEVVGFTASDVILSAGTAPGTLSAVVSGSGVIYTVTVTGMTANGSVVVSIPGGAAQDSTGNLSHASTSIDNSVDYDIVSIEIMDRGVTVMPSNTALVDNATYGSAFSTLKVEFKEDVNDPAGDDDSQDVTNPENYLLVRAGINKKIDTESCLGGVSPDDTRVAVSKAVYDNQLGAGPFIVTLTLNQGKPLPSGYYRLLLCGTTSITDLAGNKLHDGNDVAFNFTIEDSGGEGDPNRLPLTGFAAGQVTYPPEQPAGKTYTDTSLRLAIPALGIDLPITGVPLSSGEWDTTWLGQQAGYLEGSAFPAAQGNSVLTGHVWDANNQPGPFVGLRELAYGTPVLIHAWGKTYTYQVFENTLLDPGDVQAALHSKEKGTFVTLVTCESFRPANSDYRYRRMVRAVLVSVSEK